MKSKSKKPRRLLRKLLLAFVVLMLFSLLADRVVSWFVPALPPPQIAHPTDLTVHYATDEFEYDLITNNLGIRYPEIPIEKPNSNEYRVVVIGDSFTEGVGVTAEDTFAAHLEAAASNSNRTVRFINCGLSAAGPKQFARILFCIGFRYQPDMVIINLHANDLNDSPLSDDLEIEKNEAGEFNPLYNQDFLWKPEGFIKTLASKLWPWTYARMQTVQSLLQDQKKPATFMDLTLENARKQNIAPEKIKAWQARLSDELILAAEQERVSQYLVQLGLFDPDMLVRSLDIGSKLAEQKWMTMHAILTRMVNTCKQTNLKVVVLYTPTAHQYDATIGTLVKRVGFNVRPEWLTETVELERRIQKWAGEVDVPYFSMTQSFRERIKGNPGAFNFENDEHWNPAGHAEAAKLIEAWLREKSLWPGN